MSDWDCARCGCRWHPNQPCGCGCPAWLPRFALRDVPLPPACRLAAEIAAGVLRGGGKPAQALQILEAAV